MSILRSPNCSKYTDTVSLLVGGTAQMGDSEKCSVTLPSMFSCQTKDFENPDAQTSEMLTEKAKKILEKDMYCKGDFKINFSTNLVGAQNLDYAPEKLKQLGMTSNCFREGNDPNHATHVAKALCYPMKEMTDSNGNRVMNTNMKIHSNLAVCDISDGAMAQVQEDLRKVAAHNATENGYKIDRPEDLACSFSVLPHL